MTRWSAITRTRGRRSALAYGSRSATAAEETTSTGSYTTSRDATDGYGASELVRGVLALKVRLSGRQVRPKATV
jgi:hypothetical protein